MQLQDCWNTIGTWGRNAQRCERLEQLGHCTNCEVYRSAGRQLLERAAPDGYLQEWSQFLASPVSRLGSEAAFYLFCQFDGRIWALRTALLEQVTHAATIRRLPHQRNPRILGVTHIRGDVLPCLSFAALLSGGQSSARPDVGRFRRFVVCSVEQKRWVLPVEDVLGLQRVDRSKFQAIPLSDTLSPEHALSAGFYPWRDNVATMLDSERFASALKQVSA